MKKRLLCALLTVLLSGCAKIHEDVREERTPRPRYDVEIPVGTPWDSIPEPDKPVGN